MIFSTCGLYIFISAAHCFLAMTSQAALISGASNDGIEHHETKVVRRKREDKSSYVMTQADRMAFLSAHNQFRRDFTTSGFYYPQPEASNIPRVYWSALLEASATAWSSKCYTNLKHGQPEMTSGPKFAEYKDRYGTWIGQNLYRSSGKPNPANMVYAFANETQYYTYVNGVLGSCVSGKICGHFTQVIWSNTILVGCGSVKCGDVWIGTCNYSPGGNVDKMAPYRSGPVCSLCSENKFNFTECEDRLCVPKDRCSPIKECTVVDTTNCLCSEGEYKEIVTALLNGDVSSYKITQTKLGLVFIFASISVANLMQPLLN